MRFFGKTTKFDFMGKRKIALALSIICIVASISMLASKGLNFGIDFTGGTLVELGYSDSADLDAIRDALANSDLGDAVVQNFGSTREVLIRLAPKEQMTSAELSTKILDILQGAEMRRVEFVGPQVGDELRDKGGIAMLVALFCILVYVAIRFEWRFAMGSVAALVHDVIIVLGAFALLQMDFDLPVLAAVLAVIGYSLNDTIVVFDRIRENFRRMRKSTTINVVNASLNQTLARTLMTSLTTLLVLVALFYLGGELIHAFAAAMIIGVVIGTYSSMYIASTTVVALGISRKDMMPVEKDKGADDNRP